MVPPPTQLLCMRVHVNKSPLSSFTILVLVTDTPIKVSDIFYLTVFLCSSLVSPPYRGAEVWVRKWPWELYQR